MTTLLFDLDRTLVDVQSFTDYDAAARALAERFGPLPSASAPGTYWRPGTVAAMEALLAWSGDARWQEASDLVERFELAAVARSVAMPGLPALLNGVGDRPWGVVTLMGPTAARAVLERHGIVAAVVVGRVAELRPKPAPDQLVAALDRLGADPAQAVMVGDSSWDREAAEAAGTAFVGVSSSDFGDDVPVAADLEDLLRFL